MPVFQQTYKFSKQKDSFLHFTENMHSMLVEKKLPDFLDLIIFIYIGIIRKHLWARRWKIGKAATSKLMIYW